MPSLVELLKTMVERDGSDLHISTDTPPQIRVHGHLERLLMPELSPADSKQLVYSVLTDQQKKRFEETQELDFSFGIKGMARFRCNVFNQRGAVGAVYRLIPEKIRSFAELGLPAVLATLSERPRGLVLVTGPTGSGKSTTLAAMLDKINLERHDHILTIEDPIEYIHQHKNCLVNQREVHSDTNSFANALRAALREDPDIVLVGEMRDLETVAIAIETAETGHLVFGTLHTTTAASTVDRVIDQFPTDRQAQIRVMLSESLRGVISQTLCKKIGGGRVAALEVLIVTPAVSNLIREAKTFQIPSMMQVGKAVGMVSLNDALMDLVIRKVVAPEEAYLKAVDKAGFEGQLKRAGVIVKPAATTLTA